jgi:small subunit ribosomal protein S6
MFILDSNRYGRDPDGVSGQISAMIEKLGGEMLVSRLWEERRLAYTIKGQRKGTYWLTYFRLAGGQFAALRRQCEINENIMRFLFLKIDPRIVDALVAHAQAAPVPVAAPAAPAAPAQAETVAVAAKIEAVEEIDVIAEELEE